MREEQILTLIQSSGGELERSSLFATAKNPGQARMILNNLSRLIKSEQVARVRRAGDGVTVLKVV
jgi:hypothetical protein